jgi:hypothetical protein
LWPTLATVRFCTFPLSRAQMAAYLRFKEMATFQMRAGSLQAGDG